MCKVVDEFCHARVIPRAALASPFPSPSSPPSSLPPSPTPLTASLEAFVMRVPQKPVKACTIEDLRQLGARVPLSNYAFSIAAKLTYEKLAGSKGRLGFEGHGGGMNGCKGAETEGDQIFQYGGMYENFVQEMSERLGINKNDIFVDVGSGIGQVAIQVAATMGKKEK